MACLDALVAGTQAPEQCQPMIACLKRADAILRDAMIPHAGYSIHRLSKVSLGWQMEFLYKGVEDGGGASRIVEHLACLADGERVIKIGRRSGL